jgi:hypothetical protein
MQQKCSMGRVMNDWERWATLHNKMQRDRERLEKERTRQEFDEFWKRLKEERLQEERQRELNESRERQRKLEEALERMLSDVKALTAEEKTKRLTAEEEVAIGLRLTFPPDGDVPDRTPWRVVKQRLKRIGVIRSRAVYHRARKTLHEACKARPASED